MFVVSAGEDAEGGAAAEGAAGVAGHTVGGGAGAAGPASSPTMQHTRPVLWVMVIFVALSVYQFCFLKIYNT